MQAFDQAARDRNVLEIENRLPAGEGGFGLNAFDRRDAFVVRVGLVAAPGPARSTTLNSNRYTGLAA